MTLRCEKLLSAFMFCLFSLAFTGALFAAPAKAPETQSGSKMPFDPSKVIMEHVGDAHEFHFFTLNGKSFAIPLPVIIYSSDKGFSFFNFSKLEEENVVYDGYVYASQKYLDDHKLSSIKDKSNNAIYQPGKIYKADAHGLPVLGARFYDFSLTRNVVQMLISVILLLWIMLGIAAKYKNGYGVKTAPSGFQNVMEPIIMFVRDDVAKNNLGEKHYRRFTPMLQTMFFFILINNLIGLVPSIANVTGNIAFTAMMGMISFIVLMVNTTRHYWGEIVNPEVPVFVKPIMIPIEIIEIFTKPFALIIRLFANMLSGHIIIMSFIILIFVFGAMNTALGWGTSPVWILLAVFIYLIEILIAFIQSYIFTNLTAVFLAQSLDKGKD